MSEQSGQESVLRDEIIRMAREAGLSVGTNISGIVLVGSPAEIGLNHLTIDELERFVALIAAAEREACAKACEAFGKTLEVDVGDCFAEAIRARGEA